LKKSKNNKTPCPLCQSKTGVGTYEKAEPPKTTYMGGYIGTWLSKSYRLEGDKLRVTVTAQHQSESDIYYDDDDDRGRRSACMVMNFRIAFCPVCKRKIIARSKL